MALNRVCSEDFSFPLLTSRVPRIGSPPLWKPSPERGLARPVIGKDGDNDLSKSFSYVERRRSLWTDKAEEKMDMLWEDLNEELPPRRSQSLRNELSGDGGEKKKASLLIDESSAVAVGCGMKLTKKTQPKKKKGPNVLVLMRVLKKLLVLRSSSQRSPAKTHPRHTSFLQVITHKLGVSINFAASVSLRDASSLVDSILLLLVLSDNSQNNQKLMGVLDVQGPPSSYILRKSQPLRRNITRVHCKNLTTMGDSFIRPHLRQLAAYQPILPFEVLSAQLGRKPEDIVKLDANENPYGPPPEASNMKFPYVYPDPQSRRLRDALAQDSGLEPEYILVGCGADELIDLIMRCVLDPGEKIVDCPPTFSMYVFDAAVNGAGVIKVPRNPDFSLNVDRIAQVVELEKPKCIFLTSPNNPDGSIISEKDLLKILDMPILVVLDEAYIEFSGVESRMQWVKKYENLIVLRTFSKRAGLAGLRVGYGAFPLSIIEYMWRAKQPYNVSVAGEVAALAALSNGKYLEDVRDALVRERERLFGLLKEVPFLNPYPSYSNFILCEVTSGMDAKKLKEDLAKMGVMVRHYNSQELKGYVRVSAGKPEHTDALMDCLKQFY
ncbi:hypothetical protein HID58_005825 [Brassica napus]|uniref:histidinol-phosphate transaminase n=2 Tax=Brassica napus TaxID=3708 RepID=A0ABQ8E9Q3_BRANA|nr:hypothetical protein HID58_005825 [Brassica napus]